MSVTERWPIRTTDANEAKGQVFSWGLKKPKTTLAQAQDGLCVVGHGRMTRSQREECSKQKTQGLRTRG